MALVVWDMGNTTFLKNMYHCSRNEERMQEFFKCCSFCLKLAKRISLRQQYHAAKQHGTRHKANRTAKRPDAMHVVFCWWGKVELPACGRAVPRLWRATGTPFTTAPLQIHHSRIPIPTKRTPSRDDVLFAVITLQNRSGDVDGSKNSINWMLLNQTIQNSPFL